MTEVVGDRVVAGAVNKVYLHSRKAGNRGDVWKHYALARILENKAVREITAYIETHAGAGVYELKDIPKAREWKQGILRVARRPEVTEEPFQAILKKVNPSLTFPGRYPGSAFIASRLLPGRRYVLFEQEEKAAEELRRWIPEADVRAEDGYAGLASALLQRTRSEERIFVFIDPPYKGKKDWETIPKQLAGLPAGSIGVVWYHVAAYSNPDNLHFWCQMSGLRCWAVECIVDAPRAKPSRKPKGSGLLVLNLQDQRLCDELMGLAKRFTRMMTGDGERPTIRIWHSTWSTSQPRQKRHRRMATAKTLDIISDIC